MVLTLTADLYLPRRGETDPVDLTILIIYPICMLTPVCIGVVMAPTLRWTVSYRWLLFLIGLASQQRRLDDLERHLCGRRLGERLLAQPGVLLDRDRHGLRHVCLAHGIERGSGVAAPLRSAWSGSFRSCRGRRRHQLGAGMGAAECPAAP